MHTLHSLRLILPLRNHAVAIKLLVIDVLQNENKKMEKMQILLNGIATDKSLFCINDGLNYGRFPANNKKKYEVQLPKSEFIRLMESEYNEVRDDIKKDDIESNDTSEFTNTNYCSLQKLMDYEEDFKNVMQGYLDITFFTKLFTTSTKHCKFVINSTDDIFVKNDMLIVQGRVFEII